MSHPAQEALKNISESKKRKGGSIGTFHNIYEKKSVKEPSEKAKKHFDKIRDAVLH